jgi:SAM-dependent methyltransferase
MLFDEFATGYAEAFCSQSVMEAEAPYVGRLRDIIGPSRGGLLLDVGCGPALYYSLACRFGFQYLGVDISLNMLKEGARANTRPLIVQCDVCNLPLRAGCASVAVAMGVLSYMDDQFFTRGVDEIVRVLQRGGALLLGDQLGSPAMEVDFPFAPHRKVTVYGRTEEEYLTFLELNGFEIVRSEIRSAYVHEMSMNKIVLWAQLKAR